MHRKFIVVVAILAGLACAGAPAYAWLNDAPAERIRVDSVAAAPDPTTTAPSTVAEPKRDARPAPEAGETPKAAAPARPKPQAEPPRDGLRLACATASPPERVVGCKWSPSQSAAFAAYELWSAGPERPRRVIFHTEDRATTTFHDHPGQAGVFHYKVIAVNEGGQPVGESPVVSVKVGPDDRPAPMRLECKPLANERPAVACRWSMNESEHFAGYRLVRGDEDGRRVVFETRDRTVTRALDEHVEVGHTYKYAILTVDGDGRVIAEGGPVTVTVTAASKVDAPVR